MIRSKDTVTDDDFHAKHGIDDIYWTNRPKYWAGKRYAVYVRTRDALVGCGLKVLYGGTKGHGFWIQGHVKPENGTTGNPNFWSITECWGLIDRLSTTIDNVNAIREGLTPWPADLG